MHIDVSKRRVIEVDPKEITIYASGRDAQMAELYSTFADGTPVTFDRGHSWWMVAGAREREEAGERVLRMDLRPYPTATHGMLFDLFSYDGKDGRINGDSIGKDGG